MIPDIPITAYIIFLINSVFGNKLRIKSFVGDNATKPQFNAPIIINTKHILKIVFLLSIYYNKRFYFNFYLAPACCLCPVPYATNEANVALATNDAIIYAYSTLSY